MFFTVVKLSRGNKTLGPFPTRLLYSLWYSFIVEELGNNYSKKIFKYMSLYLSYVLIGQKLCMGG